MRKDYPNGTVVKVLHNGIEGIIIDKEVWSDFHFYIVELSYGQTERYMYNHVAPAGDPIHEQIAACRRIGKAMGRYRYMYVAQDINTGQWTAEYGNEYNYSDPEKANPHLKFYWIWEL